MHYIYLSFTLSISLTLLTFKCVLELGLQVCCGTNVLSIFINEKTYGFHSLVLHACLSLVSRSYCFNSCTLLALLFLFAENIKDHLCAFFLKISGRFVCDLIWSRIFLIWRTNSCNLIVNCSFIFMP